MNFILNNKTINQEEFKQAILSFAKDKPTQHTKSYIIQDLFDNFYQAYLTGIKETDNEAQSIINFYNYLNQQIFNDTFNLEIDTLSQTENLISANLKVTTVNNNGEHYEEIFLTINKDKLLITATPF